MSATLGSPFLEIAQVALPNSAWPCPRSYGKCLFLSEVSCWNAHIISNPFWLSAFCDIFCLGWIILGQDRFFFFFLHRSCSPCCSRFGNAFASLPSNKCPCCISSKVSRVFCKGSNHKYLDFVGHTRSLLHSLSLALKKNKTQLGNCKKPLACRLLKKYLWAWLGLWPAVG